MQSRRTVLVVDHDRKVLDRVETVLKQHGYSVAIFSSPTTFLRHQIPTPACAIIDAELQGFAASELQSWLARTRPEVPVIQMTEHGNVPQAVEAIRGGVVDFLTKPIDEKMLICAVRRAFVEEERHRYEQAERALYKKRFGSLTPRERQVCAQVVEGKLNKQIAAEFGTHERTVKVHRGRVMKKMGVQSLAELVRIVLTAGLDLHEPRDPARKQLPDGPESSSSSKVGVV
jgi:FixJ family two-component response regulator